MSSFTACHAMLGRIAPELTDVAIVDHPPGDPAWPVAPGVQAYCLRGYHAGARALLRIRGEWRGICPPLIVIVERPPSEAALLATVLHEASHLLPAVPPLPDPGEPSPEQAADHRQHLAFLASRAASVDAEQPWRAHGADFVRRACHLAHRASIAGFGDLLHLAGIAGQTYGLSHAADYYLDLHAVGELDSHLGSPFSRISRLPFPNRFAARFVRAIGEWHLRRLLEVSP